MWAGECIRSNDNRYVLVMQRDGNLVLYQAWSGRACWASSWEVGRYRAGDKMYVDGWLLPNGVWVTQMWVGQWGNGATLRESVFDTVWRPKGFNVSLNSRGEIWIGYWKYRSC